VDDAVATRRRVWFGSIMVVAFALLIVGALLPSPSKGLHTASAGADETIPGPTELASADLAVTPVTVTTPPTTTPAPATEAPAPTTAEAGRPTTTTTDAPARASAQKPVAVAVTVTATPAPPSIAPNVAAILACIRQRESHGDYTTVSASGSYRGAYQFNQSAWDAAARHAGRLDLVGQLANLVSPADQDAVALALYQWQGTAPWGGACD